MGGTRKQHAYAKVKSEAAADMRPREVLPEGFEWYRSLFEMASEGFLIGRLILNPEGRTIDFTVLQVNRACEELTGLGREKLAGRRISEIAPSDEPGWLRHIGEVVSGAGPARFEGYSAAIGKWLEINACPLNHDDLYAVFISDVTQRKRAEEAFLAGETFLNNIFESIQDGISVLDKDFNIVRANHIIEKWYPHMAPLKGKKCYQAYHGRSQPCDVCPSLRAIRHKDKQSDIVPFHDGSGEIKGWQELFAYPLVDEAGCVTGVIEHVRDITERRRHEESLRESEEKFRAVAETASAAICILQDGKFQYVNPAMEAISGYRKDELASIDFQAMLHSEAKEHIMAQYGRWLAGTSPEARSELKGISRDGEVRWADVSRKTISYRGRPAVLLTGTDITERKQVEEALRRSEERYRLLAESSADFIYIIGRDFRVQYVNRAGATALRSRPEDVVGQGLERLFPAGTTALMKESLSGVFETGKPHSGEMVHRFFSRDFYIHVVLTPFFNAAGNVSAVMGVSRDINDVKRAEMALRESEEKFRVLAETSPTAICVFRDGRFIYANPAVERISGYAIDEILGMKDNKDVLTPAAREVLRKRTEAESRGEPVQSHFEFSFYHKDRSVRWLDVSVGPVIMGGLPAFMISAFDITERKRAEKELLEAKAQAELYLDLMGHDINNMHQMALGYLEIVRDTQVDEGLRTLLDKPIEALERSARLIRNVRKLQKLRDGLVRAQTVDLCALLPGIGREYEALTCRPIPVELGDQAGCYVQADELLYDVFANLVGNAVKHTDSRADIRVSLEAVREGDRRCFKVSVEDSGPGVPDDYKDLIFKRLLKGSTKTKGSGIGLYLVKTLVDSYHGRVWVEDRVPGDHAQGARFVVLLPAAQSP